MYPISASGIADSFVTLGSMLSYRTDHDERGDDDMLWGQGTRYDVPLRDEVHNSPLMHDARKKMGPRFSFCYSHATDARRNQARGQGARQEAHRGEGAGSKA